MGAVLRLGIGADMEVSACWLDLWLILGALWGTQTDGH